jgi:hypothetical protein
VRALVHALIVLVGGLALGAVPASAGTQPFDGLTQDLSLDVCDGAQSVSACAVALSDQHPGVVVVVYLDDFDSVADGVSYYGDDDAATRFAYGCPEPHVRCFALPPGGQAMEFAPDTRPRLVGASYGLWTYEAAGVMPTIALNVQSAGAATDDPWMVYFRNSHPDNCTVTPYVGCYGLDPFALGGVWRALWVAECAQFNAEYGFLEWFHRASCGPAPEEPPLPQSVPQVDLSDRTLRELGKVDVKDREDRKLGRVTVVNAEPLDVRVRNTPEDDPVPVAIVTPEPPADCVDDPGTPADECAAGPPSPTPTAEPVDMEPVRQEIQQAADYAHADMWWLVGLIASCLFGYGMYRLVMPRA